MVYCFDLDNTLCETYSVEYEFSKPIQSRIDIVNKLYEEGHLIVVQTGRHWRYLALTEKQLTLWDVRHNSLVMGNVPADFYINDRSIPLKEFFKE